MNAARMTRTACAHATVRIDLSGVGSIAWHVKAARQITPDTAVYRK